MDGSPRPQHRDSDDADRQRVPGRSSRRRRQRLRRLERDRQHRPDFASRHVLQLLDRPRCDVERAGEGESRHVPEPHALPLDRRSGRRRRRHRLLRNVVRRERRKRSMERVHGAVACRAHGHADLHDDADHRRQRRPAHPHRQRQHGGPAAGGDGRPVARRPLPGRNRLRRPREHQLGCRPRESR